MTLDEIKKRVSEGVCVYWSSTRYRVERDTHGVYMVVDRHNGTLHALEYYGQLQGNSEDFYIGGC